MKFVADITTDRGLYFAVSQLIEQYKESTRSLEEYLRALCGAALRRREQDSFAPDEFFDVLAEAFTSVPIAPAEEFWRESGPDLYAIDSAHLSGRPGWIARVVRQIIDLREMATNGQLADKQRYFGINAPRGSRWYNFDPCGFLECATAGTFGGRSWEDDPDLEAAPLTAISWEDFRDFLLAGQQYE